MNLQTQEQAKKSVIRLIEETETILPSHQVVILGGLVDKELKTVIFDYIIAEKPQ